MTHLVSSSSPTRYGARSAGAAAWGSGAGEPSCGLRPLRIRTIALTSAAWSLRSSRAPLRSASVLAMTVEISETRYASSTSAVRTPK